MIRTILFDLDDTLLSNNVDIFMQRYFGLLSAYAGQKFDESVFMPNLIQSTRAMIQNTDPGLTNAEIFWAAFEELTGGRRADLEPFFDVFYEKEFMQLKSSTSLRPAAARLVQEAIDRDLLVVVATNPLFPRVAIEQRLEWAGLPISEFDFALVTTYENMHAAKPQPAYYREILARLGVEPRQALMVGDDWRNDISPSAKVGLFSYWIAPDDATPIDPALISGHGSLDALADKVANGWLEELAAAVA